MELQNLNSGKPENIPDDQIPVVLAAGTHTAPAGQRVLLNPKGQLVFSPDADAAEKIEKYGYHVPTQEHLTEFANQAKYGEGLGNEVKAGVEGALRGATGSLSDWVLPAVGITEKEAMLQREQRNPDSAATGLGLGVAVPALLGDEVGPAALLAKAGKGIEGALAPAAIAEGAGLGAKALYAGQGLAAKVAGEAAVGAGFGAMQASSEAALGDPDLTAERVAADIGYGALVGGGLGGILGGGKIIRNIAADAGVSVGPVAKHVARILTGVNGDAVDRYLARPEMVNAAEPFQDVADRFRGAIKEAEDDVSFGSSQGYHILEESGKTFPSEQITRPILDMMGKIEERGEFSQQMKGALKNIEGVALDIENAAERNGGELTAPQVKRLVTALRDENKLVSEQRLGAGGQISSMLKKATGEINDTLKAAVPEYAEHMVGVAKDTEALKDMSKLFRSPQGADNLLRRVMNGKNVHAERALENFDAQFQTTFKDDLLDSWAKDAFTRDTTNGSRKTVLGAVVGHAIGGPLGSMVGSAAGAAADKFGTAAVKKVIDAVMATKAVADESKPGLLSALVDKYGPTTLAAMDTAAIGAAVSMMAKGKDETQDQIRARKLSGLLKASDNSARRVELGTKALFSPLSPIKLDKKTLPLPDLQKIFKKRSASVEKLSTQPENMLATLHDSTVHSFEAAPNVSASLQTTIIRGNQFLSSKIPRPIAPKLPFDKPFTPSTAQITSFNRYYETVHDPLVVLDQLKANRLHSESLESLVAVYPKLYDEMKQGIIAGLSSKEKTLSQLPFQRRAILSTFLGQPLSSALSPQNIAANQQVLTGQRAANDAKEAAQSGKVTQGGLAKLSVADRATTAQQQAAQREA